MATKARYRVRTCCHRTHLAQCLLLQNHRLKINPEGINCRGQEKNFYKCRGGKQGHVTEEEEEKGQRGRDVKGGNNDWRTTNWTSRRESVFFTGAQTEAVSVAVLISVWNKPMTLPARKYNFVLYFKNSLTQNRIYFFHFSDFRLISNILLFPFSVCQMSSEKNDAIWLSWLLTSCLSFSREVGGLWYLQCCLVNDYCLMLWMPALIYNPVGACLYSIPCRYLKTSFIMHKGHGFV